MCNTLEQNHFFFFISYEVLMTALTRMLYFVVKVMRAKFHSKYENSGSDQEAENFGKYEYRVRLFLVSFEILPDLSKTL